MLPEHAHVPSSLSEHNDFSNIATDILSGPVFAHIISPG